MLRKGASIDKHPLVPRLDEPVLEHDLHLPEHEHRREDAVRRHEQRHRPRAPPRPAHDPNTSAAQARDIRSTKLGWKKGKRNLRYNP